MSIGLRSQTHGWWVREARLCPRTSHSADGMASLTALKDVCMDLSLLLILAGKSKLLGGPRVFKIFLIFLVYQKVIFFSGYMLQWIV